MLYVQCDWPDLASVPALTSSRVGNIPIEEIDAVFSSSVAAVEEMKMLGRGLAVPLLQFGLSVYHLDTELLARLKPDVILTCLQTAHSCILEGELRDVALYDALGYVPKVVHCNAQDMEGIWMDMMNIAAALGVPSKGQKLIESQKYAMEAAIDVCRGREKAKVACIQWPQPLMMAGAWVSELLAQAGAEEVTGSTETEGAGMITTQELVASSPDVIVFALCGLSLDVAERAASKVVAKLGSSTKAFASGKIAVMDGVRMMSRPGPLLKESLECLVEILHPEAQRFGHHGRYWRWIQLQGQVD